MLMLCDRNAVIFGDVYGMASSGNYTATLTFSSALDAGNSVLVNGEKHTISATSTTLSIPLALEAKNNNTITITSPFAPLTLLISDPPSTFYPATSFTIQGNALLTTCHTDLCEPVGSKVSNLSPLGSASLTLTNSKNLELGPKYVEVYFCNNDIAFDSSWTTGTNTRNMTIGVNGITTRIEVPLSGRSSELFR